MAMEKDVLEEIHKMEEDRERHMQNDGERHPSLMGDGDEVD